MSPRVHRWLRGLLGLAVVGVAVALAFSGVLHSISADEIRQNLLDLGVWGALFFVLAFALLQPFGLSAHLFIIAASLVWAPALGAGLSLIGALAASCAAFAFARYMARQWVQTRLPERMRRWDDRLARDGFRTVLVLRVLFFTFGPMQLMLGVSKVRFWPFVGASALGLFPIIALESFVSSSLVAWLFG